MNEVKNRAKNLLLEQKSKKKLWVFFDELNTTDCLGLLSEIICERKMLG